MLEVCKRGSPVWIFLERESYLLGRTKSIQREASSRSISSLLKATGHSSMAFGKSLCSTLQPRDSLTSRNSLESEYWIRVEVETNWSWDSNFGSKSAQKVMSRDKLLENISRKTTMKHFKLLAHPKLYSRHTQHIESIFKYENMLWRINKLYG